MDRVCISVVSFFKVMILYVVLYVRFTIDLVPNIIITPFIQLYVVAKDQIGIILITDQRRAFYSYNC